MRLTEVLVYVVEFPFVAGNHVRWVRRLEIPRRKRRGGGCDPAIVVDGAVTHNLKVLDLMRGCLVFVREGVDHADTFHGLLFCSIDHRWLRDVDGIEDC